MQVNGPSSLSGPAPASRPHQAHNAPPNESAASPGHPVTPQDEVEISEASRMFDQLRQSSEVRAERLARIKAEIDAGTYETPEKLEAALLALFDEVGVDVDGDD